MQRPAAGVHSSGVPWSRQFPAAKTRASDMSFLLLEQAEIFDGELPVDPVAFANRPNQLVLRGVEKSNGQLRGSRFRWHVATQ